MGFLQKLQDRWKLNSIWQVVIVLIVFACTGFSVLFLKKPILGWILNGEEPTATFTTLYWIFIFPIYNVILLFYGFIFGQFNFFWQFEKKMWYRMTGQNHKIEQ